MRPVHHICHALAKGVAARTLSLTSMRVNRQISVRFAEIIVNIPHGIMNAIDPPQDSAMHNHLFREVSFYQGQRVRHRADERVTDSVWTKISDILELTSVFDNLVRIQRIVRDV